jgi:hypothetical protein
MASSYFFKYIAATFLFLNCIFYRQFSYISLGKILFITEVLLLFSASVLIIKIFITQRVKFDKYIKIWFIFVTYGTILLFINNNTGMSFKFREFVAVGYSVFFFITVYLLSDQKASDLIFRSILLGSLFSIGYISYRYLANIGNITTTEGVMRYGNYEFVAIAITYGYYLARLISKVGSIILNLTMMLVCIFTVVFFIAHTSAMLGMILTTLVILKIQGTNKQIKILLLLSILTIPIILFTTTISSELDTNFYRFTRIFSSDIFSDPNVSWRLLTWLHALSQMDIKSIIFGVGWGFALPIYSVNDLTYATDGYEGMHNSLLFYFFHTGFIGISLFFVLIYRVYRNAYLICKKLNKSAINCKLTGLIGGNIGILVFSLFNVVLEGPYMAIVFWFSLGLMVNYVILVSFKNKPKNIQIA